MDGEENIGRTKDECLTNNIEMAVVVKDERGDKRIKKLLKYLKDEYSPNNILYPGSGLDTIPREVFGYERCIYTGLPETSETLQLEPEIYNAYANYLENPFSAAEFDLIYIHNTQIDTTIEAVEEMNRILKPGGLVVIAFSSVYKVKEQDQLAEKYIDLGYLNVTPKTYVGVDQELVALKSINGKEIILPEENRGQKIYVLKKSID